MRNRPWGLYLSLITLSISSLLGVSASAQVYVEGEVIVKMRDHKDAEKSYAFVGKAISQKGMSLKRSWQAMGLHHFKGKVGKKTQDLINDLKNDPDVELVEPNYIYHRVNVDQGSLGEVSGFNTAQSAQAMADSTGLSDFWQSSSHYSGASSSRPIVAVIDSGVDINHPVFVNTNSIWVNPGEVASNGVDDDGNGFVDDIHGWNFVSNNNNVYDDDRHGTHVAGIILNVDQDICNESTGDPNTGLVDARIQIMALKFLDANGSGTTSDAIEAIYYAVNNGAVVLNNSWGGTSRSEALHSAIAYSYEAGVAFVAAAGNNGSNNDSSPLYPASYEVPNIISVAATNSLDNLASFSNYGLLSVDLGSPGASIYSSVPGTRCSVMSGTSMAAPMVSGTAIQMEVENSVLRGYQIKNILFAEVQKVTNLSQKIYTEGRIIVNDSVLAAKSANPDPNEPVYAIDFSQDRELASAVAGGGCGTVAKIYRQRGGGGSTPVPETWYVLIVMAVLALPLMVSVLLKRQAVENKRRYERFNISSDVRLKFGEREWSGSISTISLGGAQVNTEAILENGGVVAMTIQSPDGKEQIQVEGRVVWNEANKAYGVAFKDATYSVLERISNWTKSLQKARS